MISTFINEHQSNYGMIAFTTVFATLVIVNLAGIARIREFVIHFTQLCAVFSLTFSAVLGALAGSSFGHALQSFYTPPSSFAEYSEWLAVVGSAAAGGFLFFALAAIPLSLLFVLTDISINTRARAKKS